jgi:hypothetical protein
MPAPARQPLEQLVRKHQKLQRDGLDAETLAIEDHRPFGRPLRELSSISSSPRCSSPRVRARSRSVI